ncbi:MAG: hypothetical protein ACR2MP_03445 [Streptosporangiaceae bacterium]
MRMSRLIRSITYMAAAAGLALPAAPAATAVSAATGPVTPTKEEAGYQFTGAQFRYAQASVYLRNASQYSGSIGGLGQSVQFWGGGKVYVLGVSNTTTSSPWSPNVAVFNNSTHALVCAASLANCPDQSGGFGSTSYPTGHTITESVFYSQSTGNLTFLVDDVTAGTSASYTVNVGTGVSFKEVRIGTEFGNDPWSAPAFTAPAAQTKVAAFSGGQLTNYKGTKYGFSGYFTTSPLIMTGAGSVTEANAGPLNSTANGFSTYLVP